MPFRIKLTLIALGLLLVMLTVVPLIIPVAPLADTVAAKELADPDSHFIEVNGLQVHYKTFGAGEPTFLLLHGFGSSTFSWREVLAPLGERGTALAFDRPAFGLTERPLAWTGVNPYSLEGQEALTLGLMDALNVPKAVLVGNSSGGALAVRLALDHPERVTALVLVDPALAGGGGAPAWARLLFNTPQMDRAGPLLMRQFGGDAGADLVRGAWSNPERVTDEVLAGYRKFLRVEDWDKTLWEFSKANRAPNLTPELAKLSVPTLVVTGAEDAIVPPEASERIAGEIPNAQFVTLDGCGHVPQEECPDAFLEAVRGFLSERLDGMTSSRTLTHP